LRPGAAYFLQPDSSQQRRYEALRAYFVEDLLFGVSEHAQEGWVERRCEC
jgi:hypothetical protein